MKICAEVADEECRNLIQKLNAAKRSSVIVIVGKMSIEYTGRASSYAHPAHRLLMLKPDGTLLIHESRHVDPLNWQPPKSVHHFECAGGRLRIKSIRGKPREEVVIEFEGVEFIKLCKLSSTRLNVIGRELDVVRAVVMNPSIVEEDSHVVGTDVATPYGRIDVLLRRNDTLIVVEVKNEKAGVPAVVQLKRYVEYYLARGYTTLGVLIAPEVSQEAWIMLNREGFRYIDFNALKSKSVTGSTLEKFIKIDKE